MYVVASIAWGGRRSLQPGRRLLIMATGTEVSQGLAETLGRTRVYAGKLCCS
jgi:hypothetical protein